MVALIRSQEQPSRWPSVCATAHKSTERMPSRESRPLSRGRVKRRLQHATADLTLLDRYVPAGSVHLLMRP